MALARMVTTSVLTALTVLFSLSAVATAQAPKLAEKTPGIEVGKPAPKFELPDQDGKKRSLDSLLKEGDVAIVFYRSASW